MRITIDTTLKTLIIEQTCTVKELNDFMDLFKIGEDWKIEVKHIISIVERQLPINPLIPQPNIPNPFQPTWEITCNQ